METEDALTFTESVVDWLCDLTDIIDNSTFFNPKSLIVDFVIITAIAANHAIFA
jgi:hypothetical protein